MTGRGRLSRVRREWAVAGLILFACGLAGCRHKQAQAVVLPQTTPVALANESTSTPLLPEPPKPKLPEVPVAEAATKPKRVRKKAAKTPAATATQPSPAPAAPETAPTTTEAAAAAVAGERESAAAIGALTVGGEQSPQTKQEAAGLIAANERRLNGLAAEIVRAQAMLVAKVRTFQRDALQALGSGDVDGARTLAMKGKLLLDDLEKNGS